jgi:UDPglucose 6-dehydrogenase
MKISVIGAGYVGLTTSACLAELGHEVFCSENDPQKLAKLQNGDLPFFEPHLEELFRKSRSENRLQFGSTEDAIDWGQCIFICVGTPPLDNGDADLSAIERVARTIAKRATGYRLVIEKSTVPVQTANQLRRHLSLHKSSQLEYDVASNPEFLREGSAVENFFHPDRIVVGAESPRAQQLMREIYQPVLDAKFTCPVHKNCQPRTNVPFLVTDTNSSELIKHASNSFLAMKISFINAVADLCEAAGADVSKVAEGIGLDPRIGASFLQPGIGFGGFCFPKDLQAFVRIAEKFGCDFSVFKEVEKINYNRIQQFKEKLKKELWVLRGKKVGVWGLAFKPNTDDIRFAPALVLIRQLLAEGAIVQAYDPQAMDNTKNELPQVVYCKDPYQAAEGVEAILVLTEWDEFRNLDWRRIAAVVERPLVLDGRNVLKGKEVAAHGFQYIGIGGVSAMPTQASSLVSA